MTLMKKLIVVVIAAVAGTMVYKLLNSEYEPPPRS